jgi:hypothetical protein
MENDTEANDHDPQTKVIDEKLQLGELVCGIRTEPTTYLIHRSTNHSIAMFKLKI